MSRVVAAVNRRLIGPPRRWLKARKKLASFTNDLRDDDIFFVGHPKSGNTWLAYMLAILSKADDENGVTLANVGSHVPTIHAADFSIDQSANLRSPRVFRNEGPIYPHLYPRSIYIVRDPRSVMVSYYHHCVHDTREEDWPLPEFVDEMLEHGCIARLEPHIERWDRQVIAWHERRKNQRVHIVRYEDLKSDCLQQMRQIANFLEWDLTDEQLTNAVTRGDFSAMRKQEEVHGAESYPGEKGSKGFFVRKGKVDGWRDELDASTSKKIEQRFAAAMALTGYEVSS